MNNEKWFVDPNHKGIVRFNDDPYTGILAGDRAKQIVDAVNSHDELIEALQYAVKVIEKSDQWWMNCPDKGGFDLNIIQSAIQKATT
jgi:hypothetical protein